MHHENGKFFSRSKEETPFGYCYYQTIRKKNFYLNSKENKLAEPILYPRNYHMAAALMMPSVIESLTLELMELFLMRRRTKPI